MSLSAASVRRHLDVGGTGLHGMVDGLGEGVYSPLERRAGRLTWTAVEDDIAEGLSQHPVGEAG